MGLASPDINILFLLKNGSLDYYNQAGGGSHVVIGFLVVVFAVSITLNVLLAVTVAVSEPLRRSSYNTLLAHMSVASAVDSFLNIGGSVVILLAVDYLARKHNTEAVWMCRTAAALGQWTLCVINWLLAALAIERAASLRITITSAGTKSLHEAQEPAMAKNARRFIPPLAWLLSAILALPLLATRNLSVAIFPYRYGCSAFKMGFPSTIAYPFTIVALGYVLPWLVIIFSLSIIVKYLTAEQQRRRRLEVAAQQRQATGPAAVLAAARQPLPSNLDDTCCCCFSTKLFAWNESKMYFLLTVLVGIYVLMLIPSVIMTFCEMFARSDIRDNNMDYFNLIGSLPSELQPVQTSVIESIFMWTRFLFSIFLPIAIFIIHKELRKKTESLFCWCCSHNLIEDISIRDKVASANVQQLSAIRRKLSGKGAKYNRVASYRTPVLFTTAEGLHLRLVDEDWSFQSGKGASDTRPRTSSSESRFRCEFCDVGIQMNAPFTEIAAPLTMSFRHRGMKSKLPKSVSDLDIREVTTPLPQNKPSTQANAAPIIVKKSVRFANTVAEIPLTESEGWSGMEDISPLPNEQFQLQQQSNSNRKLSPNSLNNIKNKKINDSGYKDTFIM